MLFNFCTRSFFNGFLDCLLAIVHRRRVSLCSLCLGTSGSVPSCWPCSLLLCENVCFSNFFPGSTCSKFASASLAPCSFEQDGNSRLTSVVRALLVRMMSSDSAAPPYQANALPSSRVIRCSVLSTKWPVCAASIDALAVSGSRVSPISITSGSCLRKLLRMVAKV